MFPLFYFAVYFSVVHSTEFMNMLIVIFNCSHWNSKEQVTFQLTQSNLFIFVLFVKVDEGIQTIGHEVIAAPGDLWDAKPASAEYWYKKKGW